MLCDSYVFFRSEKRDVSLVFNRDVAERNTRFVAKQHVHGATLDVVFGTEARSGNYDVSKTVRIDVSAQQVSGERILSDLMHPKRN